MKRDLEAKGWEVVPQVGCSGYRIDLGIKDPERPGRFLIGIECDGAMYHSAKTARDRDRLREAVLRSLGWELHRIWSTDWWQDPVGELAKAEAAIERARIEDDGEGETSPSLYASADALPAEPVQVAEPAPTFTEPEVEMGTPYVEAILRFNNGVPEEFYERFADLPILDSIREVMAVEAPIAFDVLCRSVASPWDLKKATRRLRERVRSLLRRTDIQLRKCSYGEFAWRSNQDPGKYEGFRVKGPDGAGDRSASEIPPEEYANAAYEVLSGHLSMPAVDLQREAGRVMGFSRMGKKVEECAAEGVRLLAGRDDIVMEDGVISVTGDWS